MSADRTIIAGDWVAFYRNAQIVYARVGYVRKMDRYPYTLEALTTEGAVEVDGVLEIRPQPETPQEPTP